MAWNPTTQNLLQLTDISDALDKAIEYLDTSELDEPKIIIKNDNAFALRMRMYKFMKAYKLQMVGNDSVDENKYNHLKVVSTDDEVIITSSLEQQPLTLMTGEGDIL